MLKLSYDQSISSFNHQSIAPQEIKFLLMDLLIAIELG